ncbi:MAG: DUF4145 domain-containing protein [Anaerolineales bacterium]|nr:DUF4145 domain-containing protein [Anaerolineales bacterium]
MPKYQGHRNIVHPDGSNDSSWLVYTCANCNTNVSGAVVSAFNNGYGVVKWLLCSSCGEGSVQLSNTLIYPSASFGPIIDGLPDDVKIAYTEARNCISTNAITACELMCRKILMHVAVEKGAKEGDTFAAYLTHLEGLGYITPPMKIWVGLIRENGNEATHLLATPPRERVESTLFFTAELLRLVYEMEFLARKYVPKAPNP